MGAGAAGNSESLEARLMTSMSVTGAEGLDGFGATMGAATGAASVSESLEMMTTSRAGAVPGKVDISGPGSDADFDADLHRRHFNQCAVDHGGKTQNESVHV